MNANSAEGVIKNGTGKAKAAAGVALDDPALEAKGDMERIEGQVQDLIGKVQDTVSQAASKLSQTAEKAAETSAKLADQTREAYGQISAQAKKAAEEIDPFVKSKPYTAIGLAAASGLLFGLLFAGRGPKIVYVRPRV